MFPNPFWKPASRRMASSWGSGPEKPRPSTGVRHAWHLFGCQKGFMHGSLNVPIEHHPTIRYMVYNGYYKVMSNIAKMGHLPIPVIPIHTIGNHTRKNIFLK